METYKRMNNIYKPTEELNAIERNTLSKNFFETYVRGGIKTKDNSYANANAISAMNERNANRADKEEEKQNKLNERPTLKLATVKGKAVTTPATPATRAKGQPNSVKTAQPQWTDMIINNGGVITTDAGNKKTTTTVKIIKISDK